MTASESDQQCVFCRIARGELDTPFVAETARAVAFRDLQPQAPTHVLVVPKTHLSALRDLSAADPDLAAELLNLTIEVARQEDLLDGGYRVITNDGPVAGQTVPHLHLHVLGGHPLQGPLG
ncbi:MAG: histidine triad nucleotide-binding protein [Chloroflexota bacterium]|nr:histidine triad nucleotide-binding protein [Chloroflexota bacterium]